MNILRITRNFFPIINGGSIHIHELSNEQSLRGNNLKVVTPYLYKGKKLNYKLKIIDIFSSKMFGFPGSEHLLFNSKFIWFLYSIFTSIEIIFLKKN